MKQTIALVDDDRNILTSVSMTLEQEGYQVRTYTDGESALQGITARPVDLAVLAAGVHIGGHLTPNAARAQIRAYFQAENLLLSGAIIFICACRIDVMSKRTHLNVRVSYAVLLVGALCSGLQPLFFFEWPGRADVLMNMALLVLLLSGRKLWRGRVPEPYTSAPEIDEAQQVHVVGGKGGS